MRRLLLIAAFAMTALAACAVDPAAIEAKFAAIEVQVLTDARVACQARDRVVPFVQAGAALAAVAVPALSAWVALDRTTVDPRLDAACRAIGGTVVAPAQTVPGAVPRTG